MPSTNVNSGIDVEWQGFTTVCASTGCGGFQCASGGSFVSSEVGVGCIWCSVIDCSSLRSANALSKLRQACGGGGGCGGGDSGARELLGSESASMWRDGSLWGDLGGDFGDGILRGRGTLGGRGPGPEESDGVGGSPFEHAIEQ